MSSTTKGASEGGAPRLKRKTTLIKFTKEEEKLIKYLMKSGHIDLMLRGKPLESGKWVTDRTMTMGKQGGGLPNLTIDLDHLTKK